MDLSVDSRPAAGRTVVVIAGKIDVYTAPNLRDRLVELIEAGSHDLVIDLDAVESLDSTGLGVLVGALKRVRDHQGSLRVVCTQERLVTIFRMTGLAKVFPLYDSVEAASAAGG
jgi:anti-sigma B factor antagonist